MPELNGRTIFEQREFPRCPACNSPVQLEQAEKDAIDQKYLKEHRYPPSDLPYHPAFFPEPTEVDHPLESEKSVLKLYSTCRVCGNVWVSRLYVLSKIVNLEPSQGKPSPATQNKKKG